MHIKCVWWVVLSILVSLAFLSGFFVFLYMEWSVEIFVGVLMICLGVEPPHLFGVRTY